MIGGLGREGRGGRGKKGGEEGTGTEPDAYDEDGGGQWVIGDSEEQTWCRDRLLARRDTTTVKVSERITEASC